MDQQIGGGYRDFPRFRIKTAMPALASFRPTHLFRSATKTFFSFAYRTQKINRVIVRARRRCICKTSSCDLMRRYTRPANARSIGSISDWPVNGFVR